MLEAFILGFWLIWSAERDIMATMESLVFMLVVVIMRGLVDFQAPQVDNLWLTSMGMQWVYVGIIFWMVNRFAGSFVATLLYAAAGAGGFYWLSLHSAEFAQKFLA